MYYYYTIVSLLLLVSSINAAPVQVCVEESKHRDIDGSMNPISEETVTDQRQCIILCLKNRKSPCKSAVFKSTGSCRMYSRTVKEAGLGLVPVDGNAIDATYYEILEDCPANKGGVSTDGKRRDLSLSETSGSAHQLAFKDMGPASVVEKPRQQQQTDQQGGVGNGQYQQIGSGQYQATQVPVQPQPGYQATQAPPPQPPPGQYGPWTAWTPCPQTPCKSYGGAAAGGSGGDGGVQTRSRQCQGYGGCTGEPTQQQPCPCQQGQWTEWGPWASCSASCGGGQMSRSRSCTIPNTCQGESTSSQSCGQGPCAQWSPWTGYGTCSATCGTGTQARQRSCTGYGGVGTGSGCEGPPTEQMPCPSLPPCCSEWTPWGQCSATCGQGTQTRTRNCGYNGGGTSGGTSGGSNTEQQPCNAGECAAWSNWGPWSSCSATCGGGQQSRNRQCSGNGCVGPASDGQNCPTLPCPQVVTPGGYYQPQYAGFYKQRQQSG